LPNEAVLFKSSFVESKGCLLVRKFQISSGIQYLIPQQAATATETQKKLSQTQRIVQVISSRRCFEPE